MTFRARLLAALLLAGELLPNGAAAQLRTDPDLPRFPQRIESVLSDSVAPGRLAVDAPAASAQRIRKAALLSGLATAVPIATGLGMIIAGSESEATAYAGLLVGTAGLLMGPSIGYLSLDRYGRAWTGFGIRTVGLLGSFAGAFLACGWDCYGEDEKAAATVLLVGTGLVALSAGHDIATLFAEARRAAREEAPVAGLATCPEC